MMENGKLWRMKINMRIARENNLDVFSQCRDEGIIAIGWAWPEDKIPENEDEAFDFFEENWPNHLDSKGRPTYHFRAMVREVSPGDYVWTRSNEGDDYFICKVKSGWRPRKENEFDIGNYREVTWKAIPRKLVPGFAVRAFNRPSRTICRIRAEDEEFAVEYTKNLHSGRVGKLSSSTIRSLREKLAEQSDSDITRIMDNILSPTELEDIVVNLLQSEGWRLIKSSAIKSYPKYECKFRNENGETAFVQVKSGHEFCNPSDYMEDAEKGTRIYLYSQNQKKSKVKNVVNLKKSDIYNYMENNLEELPQDILYKLSWCFQGEG